MKLTCYFYDRKGVSLASPQHLEGEPLALYAQAVEMRDVLIVQRGVIVYLHTVEEP